MEESAPYGEEERPPESKPAKDVCRHPGCHPTPENACENCGKIP